MVYYEDFGSHSAFTDKSDLCLKITWKVIVTCTVKMDMIYGLELSYSLHI